MTAPGVSFMRLMRSSAEAKLRWRVPCSFLKALRSTRLLPLTVMR